jgi:hypothetical protein
LCFSHTYKMSAWTLKKIEKKLVRWYF